MRKNNLYQLGISGNNTTIFLEFYWLLFFLTIIETTMKITLNSNWKKIYLCDSSVILRSNWVLSASRSLAVSRRSFSISEI